MSDKRSEKDSRSGLPVPAGPIIDHGQATGPRRRKGQGSNPASEGTFTAQVLSGGEKRGLRGGPETLDRAKSTYLRSEYSGPNDRRPAPGRITKTDI